jgi:hypothetical protein
LPVDLTAPLFPEADIVDPKIRLKHFVGQRIGNLCFSV